MPHEGGHDGGQGGCPGPLCCAAALAMAKGVSLLMVPAVTGHLPPVDQLALTVAVERYAQRLPPAPSQLASRNDAAAAD